MVNVKRGKLPGCKNRPLGSGLNSSRAGQEGGHVALVEAPEIRTFFALFTAVFAAAFGAWLLVAGALRLPMAMPGLFGAGLAGLRGTFRLYRLFTLARDCRFGWGCGLLRTAFAARLVPVSPRDRPPSR